MPAGKDMQVELAGGMARPRGRVLDDDHALVVAIHHIACDGLSLDVLAAG